MGSTGMAVVLVTMRTIQSAVLLLCLAHAVLAQRRGPPPDEEDESYGNSVRRPNMDVGQFPFPRGETPVFNFDQGDEVRNITLNCLSMYRLCYSRDLLPPFQN